MSSDSKNDYIDRCYCECNQFYEDVEKKEDTVKNILKEGQIILSYLSDIVENEEHFAESTKKLLDKAKIFSSFISPSDKFTNPLMEATTKSLTTKESLLTSKYIPKCKEILNSMKKFLQWAVSPKIEESRVLYVKSKESWYKNLLNMLQSRTINYSDEIDKIRKSYIQNATNYYFKLEQIQQLILSILIDHIVQIDSYVNTRFEKDTSERGSKISDISKLYLELQEKIKENINKFNKIQDSDKDIKNLQNILKSDLICNNGYVQVEIDNSGEKHLAYMLYDDKLKSISIRFVDGERTKAHKFTMDSATRDQNTCSIKVNSEKQTICLTCLDTTSAENWVNILISKEKTPPSRDIFKQSFSLPQKKEIESKEKNTMLNEVYTKSFSSAFIGKLISIVMKSCNAIGLYEQKSHNAKTFEFIQNAIKSHKNMDDISAIDASEAIKTILINNSHLIDYYLYMQYKVSTEADDLIEIRKIIKRISSEKFEILEMLIDHFTCLLLYTDQNQLDAKKLSSIFGPILIGKNNEEDYCEESDKRAEFVHKLMIEYPNLFNTSKSHDNPEDALIHVSKEEDLETKKDHDESKILGVKFRKIGFIASLTSKMMKDKNKNDNDKQKEKGKTWKNIWRKSKTEDNKKENEETVGSEEACNNTNLSDKNEKESSIEEEINDENEKIIQNLENESNEKQKIEKVNEDDQNQREKKEDQKKNDFEDFDPDLNSENRMPKNEKEEVSINTENKQTDKLSSKSKKDVPNQMKKMEFEKRDFAVLGTNIKRPMARGNLARNPKATLNFVSAEKNKEEINKSLTVQEKEQNETKTKLEPENKKSPSDNALGKKDRNSLQENFIPPSKNSSAEQLTPIIQNKSKENSFKELEQTKTTSKSEDNIIEDRKSKIENKSNEKIDNAPEKNKPSLELARDKIEEIKGKIIESNEINNESSPKKEKEIIKDLEESSSNNKYSIQSSYANDSNTKNEEKTDRDQDNNKNAEDKGLKIKNINNIICINEESKKEQGKKDDTRANLKDISQTENLVREIEPKEDDKRVQGDEENENEKKSFKEIKPRRIGNIGFQLPTITKNFNLKSVGNKSSVEEVDKEENPKKETLFIPKLKKVDKKPENQNNDEKEVTNGNIIGIDRIKLRATPQKSLLAKPNQNELSSGSPEISHVKKTVPAIPKKISTEKIQSSDSSNELMQKLTQRKINIQNQENKIETEDKTPDNKENAKQISNSPETIEVNNPPKLPPKPKNPRKIQSEIKPQILSDNLKGSTEGNVMPNANIISTTTQKVFYAPPKKEFPEIPKRK